MKPEPHFNMADAAKHWPRSGCRYTNSCQSTSALETATESATLPTLSLQVWILLLLLIIMSGLNFGRMAFCKSKCLWSCAESSYVNLKLVQDSCLIQTCCPQRNWTMPYTELKDVDAWLVHLLVGSIQSRPLKPNTQMWSLTSHLYGSLRTLQCPWSADIASQMACGIAAWEFLSGSSTLVPCTRVDSQQHAERTKSLEEQHQA